MVDCTGEARDVVLVGPEEPGLATGGYELALPDQAGRSGKVLGSREFLRFYRQNHRRPDSRKSVAVNSMQHR